MPGQEGEVVPRYDEIRQGAPPYTRDCSKVAMYSYPRQIRTKGVSTPIATNETEWSRRNWRCLGRVPG